MGLIKSFENIQSIFFTTGKMPKELEFPENWLKSGPILKFLRDMSY